MISRGVYVTPPWLPAHLLWAYLTRAIHVVTGLCLVVNRQARGAATCLGIAILVLVLLVYRPG